MACAICQTRRPRRFCPGVGGEICTVCCGTEREVTVTCPLDCPYLQDARKHDKPVPVSPEQIANRDIRVSDDLLHKNEPLLLFLAQVLSTSALETPGLVDLDLREALESLIRSYRALQNGVYYDGVPNNPLAAGIHRRVQTELTGFREKESQQLGMSRTRDSDVLGMLVFLQRLELANHNGRRRGRSFLSMLRGFYPAEPGPAAPAASPLILP